MCVLQHLCCSQAIVLCCVVLILWTFFLSAKDKVLLLPSLFLFFPLFVASLDVNYPSEISFLSVGFSLKLLFFFLMEGDEFV